MNEALRSHPDRPWHSLVRIKRHRNQGIHHKDRDPYHHYPHGHPHSSFARCRIIAERLYHSRGSETGGWHFIGAVSGALTGANVRKGRGRLVAVAAGTVTGAFLGGETGRWLDQADRISIAKARQHAHFVPVGETIQWSNPENGNHGEIRPVRDGRSNGGRYCREYHNSVVINGQSQQAYGVACRQFDGSWPVIDG